MKTSDSKLYARLATMLEGALKAEMRPEGNPEEPYDVTLRIEVVDTHRRGRPDAVLRIVLMLSHRRLPRMKVVVPVPLEGEVAGIGAAMEDLAGFAGRSDFPVEIPMLVVGGRGNPACTVQRVKLHAKVEVTQIPYRRLV